MEVVVVLGVIGLLIALLLPAVRSAREAARRTETKNNLKQIGLALHNYHDVYKVFPVGGTETAAGCGLHGWMSLLLPYLDANPFTTMIAWRRPWDDPLNRHVMSRTIPPYQTAGVREIAADEGFGLTHSLGNPAVFRLNAAVPIQQFRGGTSNGWLAGEVAGDYQPWAYPYNWRAWDAPLNSGSDSFGRPTGEGALFVIADGSVRFINNEMDVSLDGGLPDPPSDAVARPMRTFELQTTPARRTTIQLDGTDDWCAWTLEVFASNAESPAVGTLWGTWKCELPRLTADDLRRLPELCGTVRYFTLYKELTAVESDALRQLPNLEVLRVRQIDPSPKVTEHLESMASLRELVIDDMSDEQAQQLQTMLTGVALTVSGFTDGHR